MLHSNADVWIDNGSSLKKADTPRRDSDQTVTFESAVGSEQASKKTFALPSAPRTSLIVVFSDEQVEPEGLSLVLAAGEWDDVNVTIACAGEPSKLEALRKRARRARVLLAPAGTPAEELRELAMEQTPGDIVTLLNGADLSRRRDRTQFAAG